MINSNSSAAHQACVPNSPAGVSLSHAASIATPPASAPAQILGTAGPGPTQKMFFAMSHPVSRSVKRNLCRLNMIKSTFLPSTQYPILPRPHQPSTSSLEHLQLEPFAPSYMFKKHNGGLGGVPGAPPLPPASTQATMLLHGYAPSSHSSQEQPPSSSPSYKSMPSTPKSATYHLNAPPDSAGKRSQCDTISAAEDTDVDVDVDADGHPFVLAPTPAQLGRAPLQRRKNLCK